MKISASTLAIKDFIFPKGFELFEDLGLKYLELINQYPNEKIDKNILDSYNFNYSVHTPFMDVNIASLSNIIRNASIKAIKNSIDFSYKIDAESCVIHPGTIPFMGRHIPDKIYELSKKSIIEINEYSKDFDLTVTIENMPNMDFFLFKNLEDLNNFLEPLDIFMTLDVGHAFTCNYSVSEMFFDQIKHIHLSDNFSADDSHLSLGEGSIDFKKFFKEFKSFNGIYVIEVNDFKSVKKSLDYLKKL